MTIKSILIEPEVKRHAFLLINGKDSVLIDPGAKYHAEILIPEIEKNIEIKNLKYIILQSNDYLNITSIELLVKAGFDGSIICNETSFRFIEDALKHKVTCISDLDNELHIEGINLAFITAPFLPYHEGFVTYDLDHYVIFSGHLFSQDKEIDGDTLEMMVNRFHEHTLPSIEFVRSAIKKLRKYRIKAIYPRLGRKIELAEINDLVIDVMKYDFYNTTQVVERVNAKNVTYNYEMICNHMLKKLTSVYHRSDVLNVFADSKIMLTLAPDIEIDASELSSYKLYNYFFEHIFEKKGVTWLVILEPIVKKYKQLYKIKRPVIYTTDAYKQQSKIVKLNETTSELTEQVKALQLEINETTDKMLRDETTELYNERFMKEYLYQELEKDISPAHVHVLALFHIDNLLSINKKYGTPQGDETLRSLAYDLNNHKFERSMLFKQSGPGIFAFIPNIKLDDVQQNLLTCRNSIQESDIFVEPVTVSLSVALSNEIDSRFDTRTRVSSLIELTLKRMELAKSLGKSQIIDYTSSERDYIDGTVLLVDEDETYQNMMVKIFERINYKVMITSDIYEAYEKLKNEPIDMIISEINLSKLDGFQFKHMINQTKDYKDIPFIIVSHHKNLEVVTRANLLDIDMILQKPIIPEELLGLINRMRQWKNRL